MRQGIIKHDTNLNNIDSGKDWYFDKSFRFVFWKRTLVENTMVDLWEWPTPTYVFPTWPIQMRILSTSASDSSAGEGARVIRVDWLDNDYWYHVDEITLNGTTPVNFPFTNMFRINYMHVKTLGTSSWAIGDISIKHPTLDITYGIIKATFNTARQAIGTIPAWVNWMIKHWQASSGSVTGKHFTQMTLKSDSIQWVKYPWVFLVIDETWTSDNGQEITFPIPVRIPEKTDIKMSAIADSQNAWVTCLGAIMGWFEAM